MPHRRPTDHRSVVRRSPAPASTTWPVVTPLQPSVVWGAESADRLDDIYEGRAPGYTYGREGHPNATVLAEKIDWMEGAQGGTATASGMAAVSAMFLGLLRKGDHVVGGNQLYGRSLRLMTQDLPRMGFECTLADPTDAASVEAAMRPETRLILVEVVSNPTLRVADMEAIAEIAKRHGVLLAVDNTFTTPRAYRPFEHGADIVLHSVTKLLAGHSDVLLGWIAAREPGMNRAIYDAAVTFGMTPSPFDCWLAERGLHSFDLRHERAQANAAALADHLAGLDGVEAVLYPGRPDHPDHNRAALLLGENHGNMMSFRLRGGRAQANAFIKAAEHVPFAPTLGDVSTTLSHPASSSHRALTEADRAAIGITEGFFRVSVGVEDIDLLKREFEAAVAAAAKA